MDIVKLMADVPENGNQFFGCLHLLSGCVVYKPEDTRLHTLAALKFLPELIGVGVSLQGGPGTFCGGGTDGANSNPFSTPFSWL